MQRVRALRSRAVTVLERPIRPSTLLSTLRVALQSRARQYQLRDLLESRRHTGIELQKARLKAEAADRAAAPEKAETSRFIWRMATENPTWSKEQIADELLLKLQIAFHRVR